MTLTAHAVVGAAAARMFSFNPILAPIAGFASHFLIDMIPHWHYQVLSSKRDFANRLNDNLIPGRMFFIDLVRIGFDAVLGFIIAFLIFRPDTPYAVLNIYIGAAAGILPDALQFVYWQIRKEPLISLQRFHLWIHAQTDLDDKVFIGPVLQIILAVIIVVLTKFI